MAKKQGNNPQKQGKPVPLRNPSDKKQSVKKKSEPDVVYRSARAEIKEFDVMGVRSRWQDMHNGILEWCVPAEKAEDFAGQYHVKRQRIVLDEK